MEVTSPLQFTSSPPGGSMDSRDRTNKKVQSSNLSGLQKNINKEEEKNWLPGKILNDTEQTPGGETWGVLRTLGRLEALPTARAKQKEACKKRSNVLLRVDIYTKSNFPRSLSRKVERQQRESRWSVGTTSTVTGFKAVIPVHRNMIHVIITDSFILLVGSPSRGYGNLVYSPSLFIFHS